MYNEEKITRKSINTIFAYIIKLPIPTTMLIVNDGSNDNTGKIIQDCITTKLDERIKMINHSINQGYGAANRTGIKYAIENKYDYILFMDSDLTNPPRYLHSFCKKIKERSTDALF